ncbi:hypothetical protein ACFSTC_04745 [Nonomuraea ferruginea]
MRFTPTASWWRRRSSRDSATPSQHEPSRSGLQVVARDVAQVAQGEFEKERVVRRGGPGPAEPVEVDDRVRDPGGGEKITGRVRDRRLA